jgi:hypothetical protein
MPVKFLAVALIASAPLLAGSASAAPLTGSLALKNADAATAIDTVQWRGRRGGFWRGGRGVGLGLGVGAGLLLGGALAAPYYGYGPGYYGYGYDSGYDGGYVAVDPGPVGGDAVGYCQQRFRSYDVRSGTYLGYDGLRHPCP